MNKTLTEEQIDEMDFGYRIPNLEQSEQLYELARIGLQCLQAEPVAWLHKETKELNNGWDAILDNTGNWIPLIVAPGGEK